LSLNHVGSECAITIGNALKLNSTLTTLNLCDANIGPIGVSSLGDALKLNSILRTLNLSGNNIHSKEGSKWYR
jgi:hypothetical protein